MTLRELIQSVDSEQYSESPLYQKLREAKPEYGSNRHIQVKLIDTHARKYSNIIWYFARLFVSLQPLNIDIWNSEK